ncbi:MAG: CmpA/NrtA family ABC transporter substrate-binding protein, partial [Hyphomicrobium sp.]
GMSAAKSVAAVVAQRRADGVEPLTFGMVYPFSCHNYDLRHWLASAGVDPDNDVNLIVVPPPLIAGSLKSGRIDGFCVGEPWNSVAVADGSGVIVATKAELWGASPEKVLAVRSDFAASSPDTVMALIRALHHACKWLDAPSHRKTAAEILAQPAYIGIDAGILQRALTDDLVRTEGYAGQHTTDVVVFNKGGANFPWVSHAVWHLTQMIRWGQVRRPFDIVDVARRVYRPDLFRAAVAEVNVTPPDVDAKPEGGGRFFGGESFDPNDPLDYLEHVALRDRSVDLASFETARRSEL